ncbi:MAG: GNAT family N-acetyltransferase [Planctomycetota bacterium]
MAIQIHKASLEDLESLVPLFDEYRVFYGCQSEPPQVRNFLSERLSNQDSAILLAADDSAEGLGFTQLYPCFSSVAMKPIWILDDLFVAEKARRTGVGKNLLQAAAEYSSQTGSARLELATSKDNLSAKSLYESVGYLLDEEFDHYQLPTD